MNGLRRLFAFVNKLDEYILVFVLGFIGLILFVQVIMRYVFNSPLIWSEELARYLFVWMCFIGIGYGIKGDYHIKMEYFFEKFPPLIQKVVYIATTLASIGAFVLILPSSIEFANNVGHVQSSAMGLPMRYVFYAVPVGLAIGILRMVLAVIEQLFKAEVKNNVNIID